MLKRPWALPAAAVIVTAVGISAIVFGGCNGGGDSPSQATATANPPTLTATPATPTPTPLTFAITPEAMAYDLGDPAFEPLPGARAQFGVHQGAMYQIEVPDRWNGDLVLYAHGYQGYAPSLAVAPPPLRAHLIAGGYAWAASSYQANGYAVGVGAEDTRRLVGLFADIVGEPRRTYVYGISMGGHITTFLLERYPTEFDGAFAECGAVAGVGILDYFVNWTIIASYLAGVDEGRTSDPSIYQAAIAEMNAQLGSAESPTLAGRRFESVISELTGGPRPWRHEGFAQARGANFSVILDALRNPEPSLSASTNEGEIYRIAPGLGLTDAELNRAVPRLAAAPDVRDGRRFPALAPVSGRIERPYLTIANTGDFFVPISQQQIYRRAVQAAGRDDLLVQRAVRRPGHCNFTAAERIRAFDDLVRWVEDGVRPPGDDLLGDLTNVGLAFTEPLLPDDPGTP